MSSREGTPYLIRDETADDDGWVAPEPADDVIVAELVDATGLEPDDVDDLSTYVDMSALADVVDGVTDDLSFSVEGHDVLVTSAGEVSIDDE